MADLKSLTREVEAEAVGIVRFCADEVERQRADPDAVCWMVQAWLDARLRFEKTSPLALKSALTVPMIERWGRLIEPTKNANGFRVYNVRVGAATCPSHEDVPRLMAELIACLPELTLEKAYLRFEMIHPFADGNGRVGKILFNWLRGSLNNPQIPPNFFNVANP